MKITVESTTKIVQLEGHVGGVPARVWEGTTERGVRVVALVTRITPLDGDSAQFEQELQECRPPSPDIQAWPLRLIL